MILGHLIVVGPLAPPVHGVTVSTSLVVGNRLLREQFSVEHLDTSDHRTGENLGRWDVKNVILGLSGVVRLTRLLAGRQGIVYLPLSQNAAGFLRDSLLIRAAAFRGWKVVGHLRGSEFPAFYAQQPRPFRAWIRTTLEKLTSMAVMGSSLSGLFDGLLPRERIAVVSNGTPDIYQDGFERDPEIVLFLSSLRQRKGVVASLEAALRVLERRPAARFLFVGAWVDHGLEQELRERARPAGDRIRFLPPALDEEKQRLLLTSSLLLFPPVEPEGHPRVVLEAMAAGLPVVTTNRGAIAETVIDGESGFVLDEPLPEQLADRVIKLLEDSMLRERMGRAARARYLAEFTQEAGDRNLADWLIEVATSDGRVGPDAAVRSSAVENADGSLTNGDEHGRGANARSRRM
jgi:glycosyltransferase involved in cell wall biosynthesis